MLHSWTCNAFLTLSIDALNKLRTAVNNRAIVIIHDNVNIPIRVFSQRALKNNLFISGTAGTVLAHPKPVALDDDLYTEFQKKR